MPGRPLPTAISARASHRCFGRGEAVQSAARLYAGAVATSDRHWSDRGVGATGEADRIRGLVFVRTHDHPPSDWKAVVAGATDAAGFHARSDGDEVPFEARA